MLSSIKEKLNTEFIGKKILYYNTTDSTNLEAKRNCHHPDGTVFIANHQTNGRGRLSREWASDSSNAIYMSILLKPTLTPEDISKITLIAGLSVTSALNKISKEKTYIKWPNDCILNKKKVCGILTELSITNSENNVIVGIGINVNNTSFSDELKDKATSLFLENHKTFNCSEIIALTLSEFEIYYSLFLKQGFSSLIDEYSSLCITIGREVEIITPSEKYTAKAIGITSEGELLIEREGLTEKLKSGEVSVRGFFGYI